MIFLPGYIAGLFGTSTQMPFVAVGMFLLVFALLVFSQSRRNPLHKGWVKFIIALDMIWVVESLIIVFPQLFNLSFLGYALIAAVAGWVALMAVLQINGLRQLPQAG